MSTLKIATRKSRLALWQTEHVASLLKSHNPNLNIELVPLSTRGDEILDRSLQKVGGKGLFIKELEEAMLRGQADIAVHSMKDMPVDLADEFTVACVLERAAPYDALLTKEGQSFLELPKEAVLGTSSLRRASQLLAQRPDLTIKPLRGNVETRIKKWQAGEFDAIVLAQAGLERLDLDAHISQVLSPELCVPAAAQGIVGVECLSKDADTQKLLASLNNPNSQITISAERAFNAALGGDCQTPIAAFAQTNGQQISLIGLVASPNGKQVLRNTQMLVISAQKSDLYAKISEAENLGQAVAEQLIAQGAKEVLETI